MKPDSIPNLEPSAERALLVVDEPLFEEHAARGYHPERPERLLSARRGLARGAELAGARLVRLAPREATLEELARAHDEAYVHELVALSGKHAALDPDTYVAPASVLAARRAAGGAIALVDALLEGQQGTPRRGVALLRPPGHHATRERAMGFCLLNNVAVAAAHAVSRGLSRVAIVDFDVHHGNGTQDIFFDDPRVLYVSLHQFPLYPGTGRASETGEAEGSGYTTNVPLSANATQAVYEAAFERVVLPVMEQFAPELVLVSAGFDAHARDPLAQMNLTDEAYGWMARALTGVAERSAQGRIALALEGGYDLSALEGSFAAAIAGLFGSEGAEAGLPGSRAVGPSHAADLAEAEAAARGQWKTG